MKKIQNLIRNYFSFSQKEANGFIILSILMLLFLLAPFIYNSYQNNEINTRAADQKLLDSLTKIIDQKSYKEKPHIIESTKITTVKYFDFNPNNISITQWQELGLNSKLSSRIINYCSKGGKFKVKKDLLKIYGFPKEQYVQLESYILLPDTLESKHSVYTVKTYEKKTLPGIVNFDINLADTVALKKVKGIGSKLSVRIIKYRDKLGGFVRIAQLNEVYGLDSNAIQELKNHTFVERNFEVKKLNINLISFSDLSAHPYFSKKIANAIINYRAQHKPFRSIADLREIKVITEADLQKIQDYIIF